MITAEVNTPFPNRIQLQLNDFIGPLESTRLGLFNPGRDLEIYVDGDPLTVQAFTYDAANNRYLIYAPNTFDLQGTIQVTYHLPNPIFVSTGGGGLGTLTEGPYNPGLGMNSGAASPPSPDVAWSNPSNITAGSPSSYATVSIVEAVTVPFFNFANAPGTHRGTNSYTFDIGTTLSAWSPTQGYVPGALIVDSNSNVQRCTTAGTSGSVSHPTWSSTVGAPTPDGTGTLVWTCVKYIISQGDTIVLNPFWGGATSVTITVTDAIDVWTAVAAQQTAGATYNTQVWSTVASADIPYGSSIAVTVAYSDSVLTDVTWAVFSNLGAANNAIVNSSGSDVPTWSSDITVSEAEAFLSISTTVIAATVGAPFALIATNEAGNNSYFAFYGGAGGAETATAAWTVESSDTSTFSSLLISFPYLPGPSTDTSQLLIASEYGFSVPLGHTTLGVEVSITGKQSGGFTSVVFDQQTTPSTGTSSSISLGPLTPAESGEWAVFTAVFNENGTFGYFPQGGGSAVTAYTISGGTVTVTGTNNLIPGQTVMITSTGGTIDGVWLTVATATGSGWTAPTSLPDGGVGGAAALASVQGWVNLTLSSGQFYSPQYFGIWGAPIGSSTSFPAGEPLMDFDGGSKNWMGSLLLFKTNGSLPVPVNTAHLGNATIQSTTQSVTYGNVVMIWGVVTGATGDPIITDTQLNEYTIVSNQTQTISGYGDPVTNYVAVATMAATGVNVITVSQAYGVNLEDGWVAMVNELQNLVVPPNALFTVAPINPALGAESESFQLVSGLPGNTTMTFGSSTDLWGMPWSTASPINASNFGFTVQASNPNTHAVAYEVSEVQVTVYYTNIITNPVPSFALIPAYSTNGDEGLTPTAVLTVSPSSALSGQPVTLIWNTTNVAYVDITAPAFNTGYLSTTGTGIYFVASGFDVGGSPPHETITFTLAAYDSNKHAIIVDSVPLTATATLTIT
jgi:hypothetical protein